MSLPADHLQYPRRRRGMDHDRYEWSMLPRRAPVAWPGGARLALCVVVPLEWFPLDMPATPFRAVGGMERAYPDYWNYTHRDYGNRVGVFRLMRVLDGLGIRATAPVNAAVCQRYPALVEAVASRGWEAVAHGVHMGKLHHPGLARDDEAAMVAEAVATVRRATGQPVRGWLSPAQVESPHTLDLVAAEGIEWVGDWVNDDMPYPLRTARGRLYSLPCAHELSDTTIVWQFHHSSEEFAEQIRDQFELLYREAATAGGRIVAVTLHPWIVGQPHRVRAVQRALEHVMRHAGVWPATGSEIVAAFAGSAAGA